MPIGYGSNFKPNMSLSGSVGFQAYAPEKHHKSFGWTSWLRILTTIVEIGAAFIPGIGVLAETGIALTGGAINEGLDAKSGHLTLTNTLLNFAAPVAGGTFSGLSNVRQVGKALGRGVEGLEGIGETAIEKLNSAFNIAKGKTSASTFGKFNKGLHAISNTKAQLKFAQRASHTGMMVGDNIAQTTEEDINAWVKKSGLSFAKQSDLLLLLGEVRLAGGNIAQERSLILSFIRKLDDVEVARVISHAAAEGANVIIRKTANNIELAKHMIKSFDNVVEEIAIHTGEMSLVTRPSLYKRLIKKIGSKNFNDKIVQNAQLIDPNDLGRAGIERLYQIIKKAFSRYLRKFEKVLKTAESLEDAFVAGGGILVDSDWHVGYKVIHDLGINMQIVQFTYGKDTGNYKHIIVTATDKQLARYIVSPGKTYLRYWAFSKGGKALGLGGNPIINFFGSKGNMRGKLNSVLGFIPVQALKNILSLVSNYVENISAMIKGTYISGTGKKDSYLDKLKHSFINTAISRSFRLGGKVFAGGLIGAKFGKAIGRFVGAELQRVGTQIIAKGIKNVMAGKKFGKGLGQAAMKGVTVSIRSNMKRKLRTKKPNSVIVASLSARRKLAQVRRIPNAVVPGRVKKSWIM